MTTSIHTSFANVQKNLSSDQFAFFDLQKAIIGTQKPIIKKQLSLFNSLVKTLLSEQQLRTEVSSLKLHENAKVVNTLFFFHKGQFLDPNIYLKEQLQAQMKDKLKAKFEVDVANIEFNQLAKSLVSKKDFEGTLLMPHQRNQILNNFFFKKIIQSSLFSTPNFNKDSTYMINFSLRRYEKMTLLDNNARHLDFKNMEGENACTWCYNLSTKKRTTGTTDAPSIDLSEKFQGIAYLNDSYILQEEPNAMPSAKDVLILTILEA